MEGMKKNKLFISLILLCIGCNTYDVSFFNHLNSISISYVSKDKTQNSIEKSFENDLLYIFNEIKITKDDLIKEKVYKDKETTYIYWNLKLKDEVKQKLINEFNDNSSIIVFKDSIILGFNENGDIESIIENFKIPFTKDKLDKLGLSLEK